MEILTIKNLTFTYPEREIPAVCNLSIDVGYGDFLVLFGRSGCGKTTLLRCIKPQLAPNGVMSGDILFEGKPLRLQSERETASGIGFVLQSPDNQLVTDKVWHELAFGLESLGYDTPTIRRRVAEMASFFGIQNWFYKNVTELSGGQKQLLNLASVMVMQPKLLILDEPTSQLDPVAASDFLSTLKKINRELGTAVIITEQRLEEALPLASKAAVMENGNLLCSGSVADVGAYLKENRHSMFSAMPSSVRIWGSVGTELSCPVSVNEGREFLNSFVSEHGAAPIPSKTRREYAGDIRLSAMDLWFRYNKDLPDVVKGVSLTARSGELLCILGGNGTGKTTLLRLLAGLKKPYRGRVSADGKTGFLPQDPQTLFVKKTVFEDLKDALCESKLSLDSKKERIEETIKLCSLIGLESRHPYDLSGGEQQRAALAKLLLTRPDILLLDEPTKGLDAQLKKEFSAILKSLTAKGACIVMVSHDVEFCAQYADRCALFFDGGIVAKGEPREFFSGNSFYTTGANRIARGILPNAVTTEDVIGAIGGKPEETEISEKNEYKTTAPVDAKPEPVKKLPLWRKIGAAVSGVFSLAVFIYLAVSKSLAGMIDSNGLTEKGWDRLYIYGALIAFLILTAAFVCRRSDSAAKRQTAPERQRLTKRTALAVILILLLIPLTLYIGAIYMERSQYYLTAIAVLIECMLPFFMVFEGRKPKARELVIIAVLCALSVAGRAVFFMLPQFKPVLAMTIIAGVAFGGETGFLVGAVTMLVSNILFSQGPWTPWQMFAMGLIGFLAGVLYRKGMLRRTKASLCVFGALSAVIIYGGIMNPSTALIWGGESLNMKMIMSYYLTGFPMDCIHAASTVLFLLFLSEPMLEKLDRIKVKYGLAE